jgi:hypothetical protein
VDEKGIGIATRTNSKRLAGADRDDGNIDPARRSKEWQDMTE